jgi:hypothetical protein
MKRALLTVVAGMSLLAACSASTQDFQKSAEKFIEGKDVAAKAGTTFTGAACTKPAKVEAGATFTCTAKDSSGTVWNFDLTVKDKSNFEITSGQPEDTTATT